MARLETAKHGGDLRHTADERRAEVLKAAVAEFALHGLYGTSTEMIAKRIGISQPYIFRLFPSKKELFLAAVDQCFDRVEAAFRNAAQEAATSPEPGAHAVTSPVEARLHAMGHAYLRLMAKRRVFRPRHADERVCLDRDGPREEPRKMGPRGAWLWMKKIWLSNLVSNQ